MTIVSMPILVKETTASFFPRVGRERFFSKAWHLISFFFSLAERIVPLFLIFFKVKISCENK